MKQKSIGSSVTGSAGAASRSKTKLPYDPLPPFPFFAICIVGYQPFLEVGRSYKVIRPRKGDLPSDFRVIDAEGEDYLYPRAWFVPVSLPPSQKRRVAAALSAVPE